MFRRKQHQVLAFVLLRLTSVVNGLINFLGLKENTPVADEAKQRELEIELIKGVLIGIIPIPIVAVIARAIKSTGVFASSADPNIDLVANVVAIGLILATILFSPRRPIRIFLILFGATVIVIFASKFLSVNQKTVIITVDMSQKMTNLIDSNFQARLRLNRLRIPTDAQVGLAIFGGAFSGATGCTDWDFPVHPGFIDDVKSDWDREIDDFAGIRLKGYSGLQNVVLSLIANLSHRSGVQQILIITNEFDSHCDRLNRSEINKLANAEGVQYELVVTTLSKVTLDTQNYFSQCADRYYALEDVEQITQVINDVAIERPFPYGRFYGAQEAERGC